MEHIASKTFASQFIKPSSSQIFTPFQRMVLAIKNNNIQLLHAISQNQEQLEQKDQNGKNLLYYTIYEKQHLLLLYLLMRGLPLCVDNQKKNIFHVCGYYGSHKCLQYLVFHTKAIRIQLLNQQFLGNLEKYNFKRTDANCGKLKYPVSPKRLQAFKQLQQKLTELYEQYMKTYLGTTAQMMKDVDEVEQRNPLHLVCLNKYQKCYVTMQLMIQSLQNPYITLDEHIFGDYQAVNKVITNNKIDPRLFSDVLQNIQSFLSPQALQNIHATYQKQLKQVIKDILEAQDKDQQTPLYIASKNGSTKMINFLKKYVPNTKEQQKKEIMKIAGHNLARSHIIDLCEASSLPDTKPLSFLISCGEGINNKKTIYGTFALLQAVKSYKQNQNLEAIKILLKNDADVNTQDTNGWTILHHAAHQGYIQIIELLFAQKQKLGLNQNKVTNKRYHALHLAAIANHPSVIKYLVEEYKIKIEVADWDGCTALHHSAKKGSYEALKQLIALGANIYAVDKMKMSALHHASASNSYQIVKELLRHDADKDLLSDMRNSKGKKAKDLNYNTSIFENIFRAVKTGTTNTIRKLITDHPELKDEPTINKNQTPLIVAVRAQQLTSIKFLLQLGADTYHEDSDGKSAVDHAQMLLEKAQTKKNKEEIDLAKKIKQLLEASG